MAVASQFAYLGVIYWSYCLIFSIITVISAYVGISQVKKYIKRTGKQSIILIMLVFCLSLAFVSIPLKAFLL